MKRFLSYIGSYSKIFFVPDGAVPKWRILKLTDEEIKLETNNNGKEYILRF